MRIVSSVVHRHLLFILLPTSHVFLVYMAPRGDIANYYDNHQGRKSVFNIGGYNLEFRSIFRSFETLEGMIENFRAEKTLFIFEKR